MVLLPPAAPIPPRHSSAALPQHHILFLRERGKGCGIAQPATAPLPHCSVTCLPPASTSFSQAPSQALLQVLFPGNADESTHLHLCVPALCSPWLPPSIPSCIPVSPQPASPCQPHPFLSTSRVIQNPLESTEHFLWPSRTLDHFLDKLRSSLEPPLYIKLFLALASGVSHTPKLNYPPFSQLPALNILPSGVLLKEMIQWVL